MRSKGAWAITLAALMAGLALAPVMRSILADTLTAVAAASGLNDNEAEDGVPDDVLDELSLFFNWAGGGASGVIGRLCDVGTLAASGTPCEIAQNEIMRVDVSAALSSRGLASEPKPSFVLRFGDGRERAPDDDTGDALFWWVPLDAPPGNATLIVLQGPSVIQFPVKITERTGQPLVAAGWQQDGPDAPTELLPTGRAGNRLGIRLAGFPTDQDVAILLFRLVETHALGNFASFDRPLASVRTNDRGTATYVWDTNIDEDPDQYAIRTVPESQANGIFSDQGAQLCIAPRSGSGLCASIASAVGRKNVIEPLVARSVAFAARTWADLAHDPARPVTELQCVYAESALIQRRQQLQSLRASGDIVDARLTRKVRVQSVSEAKPEVMRSGIEAIVVEPWAGSVHHADGSETEIDPSRQTWRYVMKRSGGDTATPTGPPCAAGLVITEATLQP